MVGDGDVLSDSCVCVCPTEMQVELRVSVTLSLRQSQIGEAMSTQYKNYKSEGERVRVMRGKGMTCNKQVRHEMLRLLGCQTSNTIKSVKWLDHEGDLESVRMCWRA